MKLRDHLVILEQGDISAIEKAARSELRHGRETCLKCDPISEVAAP
ncbi:MAG: hypothetical protein KGL39_57615 [Patescibacteria group bacterium]|nr:hypothetical protein [Patescibacteria group bacterium]